MSRMEGIAALPGDASPVSTIDRIIPAALTAVELAAVVGPSVRYVHSLALSGVFETAGRNCYPARAAVAAFISYLRSWRGNDDLDAAKQRQAEDTAQKLEMQVKRQLAKCRKHA